MNTNGITKTETGAIVFSGREAVQTFSWITHRRMLATEVKTGLKMSRGSVLASAKAKGFVPPNTRTKKQALEYMNTVAVDAGLDAI